MKWLSNAIFFALFINGNACPFSDSGNEVPCDENHRHVRGRRLASLSEDAATREKLASIIAEQKRSLQALPGCITTETYENLRISLDGMASGILDVGDRGHFLGGIVRLAAHDFMDFHKDAAVLSQESGGSDGCVDFTSPANAGLDDIWCDDADACPFKALYDDVYVGIMSRADFWVAGATAVIENAAPTPINLPFLWGRKDVASCTNSVRRLPEPSGCDAVESTFIDRMGLSWTDAVALMGAHTLGRGASEFSGHPGTWVDTPEQSIVFDKRFYREILNRPWKPRTLQNVPDEDWVWGGQNRGVMMLNTDICLRFNIDDGADCCTNTAFDCRDPELQNIPCSDASTVRPLAFDAVGEFASGNAQNNDAFFAAYRTAWKAATELGYSSLHELVGTCEDTDSPSSSPSALCEDFESFIDRRGRTRDCNWVQSNGKCGRFHIECPVTCGFCE